MKKIIISFLFLLSISTWANICSHKHYIVSDFDDTIKVYKSHLLLSRLGYALWDKKIYAGMNILITNMAQNSINEDISSCENNLFTVLTASPAMFKKSIKKLLNKNLFPKSNLIVRSLDTGTLEHKYNSLVNIYETKKTPLILIGDDGSQDFAAYHNLKQNFPYSVMTTYIHAVKNREIYPGQKSYITSFDIALYEYLDGRLDKDSVLAVGNSVLLAKDRFIIPKYAHCPSKNISEFKDIQLPESIKNMKLAIKERIKTICSEID